MSHNTDPTRAKQHILRLLIPPALAADYQTRMKSKVLLLNLFTSFISSLLLIPILNTGFEKSPIIGNFGTWLVLNSMACFTLSFIVFNRFGKLIAAGNIAQIGIYIAGMVAGWQTGGIFSPMLFLLLIPPVFAFVLTNLRSGMVWSVLVLVSLVGIWGLEELSYLYPDGINGRMIPMAQMVILDQADFARLCILIPLLTCISIIGVVIIYETNSIRMHKLLFNERNLFAFKASHDPLTGLANREEFSVRLQLAIESARHGDYPVALVYIDLDGFKPINDTYGHHAGDTVLEEISRRLSHMVRGTDTVARLGGDEFAIILQGIGSEARARPVLEKILHSIAQPIRLPDTVMVHVRGSLGVAFYPEDASDAEQLCRQADAAMYLAKEQKNTWRCVHDAA